MLRNDLKRLSQFVERMAGLVEEIVDQSVRALVESRADLASQVFAAEERVDALENTINLHCSQLLATQQPMAQDFRYIVTALTVSNELERMADHGEQVARLGLRLIEMPAVSLHMEIAQLAERVRSLMRQSLQALLDQDVDLALFVCVADQEIDEASRDLGERLMEEMREGPDLVEPCLALLDVVTHFERMADLSTNIAKDLIYFIDGHIYQRGGSFSI